MTKQHFDIILPTIGRKSLEATVNSIRAQRHEDWNLWIIADGMDIPMTDEPKIHVTSVFPAANDSGATPRKDGIMLAHGPWIAYIDDDDMWFPDHLTTLAALIAANPGTNMVRTAGQQFSMKHKSPRHKKRVLRTGPINSTDILTPCIAHTLDLYEKTRGWQPGTAHDKELWKDMLAAGGQAIVSDAVTVLFER